MSVKWTLWQKIRYICDNNKPEGGLLMSTMNELKEESREVNLNSVEPSDPRQLPSIWYTWPSRRSHSKIENRAHDQGEWGCALTHPHFLFKSHKQSVLDFAISREKPHIFLIYVHKSLYPRYFWLYLHTCYLLLSGVVSLGCGCGKINCHLS